MDDEFTLTIKLGNDAMQTRRDIADALRAVVDKLESGALDGKIFDTNGNKVGSWEVK